MTPTIYPIPEHEHTILTVPGRMFAIQEPQTIRGQLVYRGQKWTSEGRPVKGYGTNGMMYVNIRFDDQCQNGHQSFSITADVYTAESRQQKDIAAGGCMHKEITKIFPELTPLIKWHLMDTDGPMHYISNTCYFAGNRDCNGRTAGQPSSWDTVIYFADSPVSHAISSKFAEWLQTNPIPYTIEEHNHPDNDKPGAYKFSPHYTFTGYAGKWHECPFKDRTTAEQWQTACNTGNFRIDKIVTAYSEGKTRDLDAARSAAVWPEATDEQLSLPREELWALLEARLPGLIAAFKTDMNNAGFLWEPAQEDTKP